MLAMVLVWSARKGALSVMNTGAPVKGRWASVCVIYVCNAETGSSWTSNPYRDVSFWIPWKVILAEPLLWNVIWRVVNNCGCSCPEKGLYIILLRTMSEGRNMRFKANRVIALRRSCLMGIFSLWFPREKHCRNGAIGITTDLDMGTVVPDLTRTDLSNVISSQVKGMGWSKALYKCWRADIVVLSTDWGLGDLSATWHM